ncbi:MAG: hypothetical protein M3Q14_01960 [bacterium]|nr:hypothetical protein [bacterium]
MQQTITKRLNIGLAAAISLAGLTLAPAAFAQSGERQSYQAKLTALNKSDDRGDATVMLTTNGDGTFTVSTTGSSPNLAHAQHIHIGGTNTCPDISADKDNDGLINTGEGDPSYGPIAVSLTTSGDVSKDSGVAVDRMPVANSDGTVTYERTFALPEGVTEEMIGKGVVVTHGVSELFDDEAKYDGEKKSDIPGTEELPLEATIPATCGKLTAVSTPVGGAGAGNGSTAGIENAALLGAGVAALVGAGGVLLQRNRGFKK